MTAPLVITRDETLLDELLRLAAAAGVTPDVAPDGGRRRCAAGRPRRWCWSAPTSPSELADAPAAAPRRRARRRLGRVPDDDVPDRARRSAPRTSPSCRGPSAWLVEPLDRPRRRAARAAAWTVGVVGGSGGAGATTFACALGQVAAPAGPDRRDRRRPARARARPGARARGRGRRPLGRALPDRPAGSAPASLREALPRRDGLGVLTWTPGRRGTLQPFAVREVLSAAQRGHDLVVVDLPADARPGGRRGGGAVRPAARGRRAPTVAGVASAARVVRRAARPDARCGWCVRGSGVDAARRRPGVTGVPVLAADGRPARAGRVGRPRARARCGRGAARSAGPPARCSTQLAAPVAAWPHDAGCAMRRRRRRGGPRPAGPRARAR